MSSTRYRPPKIVRLRPKKARTPPTADRPRLPKPRKRSKQRSPRPPIPRRLPPAMRHPRFRPARRAWPSRPTRSCSVTTAISGNGNALPVRRPSVGRTACSASHRSGPRSRWARFRLLLVGETEMRILSQSSDKMPAIELIQGRRAHAEPALELAQGGFLRPDRSRSMFRRRAASCSSGPIVAITGGPSVRPPRWSSTAPRAKRGCPPTRNRNL